MLANFGGWHLLLIFAVVLLLFGAARLPALARGVGQSVRILKRETKDDKPATAEPGEGGAEGRREPPAPDSGAGAAAGLG